VLANASANSLLEVIRNKYIIPVSFYFFNYFSHILDTKGLTTEMSMNTKDQRNNEKHFWNNYLTILSDDHIKPALHTWYVQHCETFIRGNKDTRLKQHTKNSITEYLSRLINGDQKLAWQKKQAIDALRLLFKSIHAPLYREIDWGYWKSSCRDLDKEHDTHYRATHPLKKQSKDPASPLDSAQEDAVAAEINGLRIAIRRKNHSIRTEKTYATRVQQFLRFNAQTNGAVIGPLDDL